MVGVGSMPSALNFSKICEFLVNPGAANSTFVGDTVEQKQTSAACKDTFTKMSLFTKSSPAGRQETQHTHNTIIALTLCKCAFYLAKRFVSYRGAGMSSVQSLLIFRTLFGLEEAQLGETVGESSLKSGQPDPGQP